MQAPPHEAFGLAELRDLYAAMRSLRTQHRDETIQLSTRQGEPEQLGAAQLPRPQAIGVARQQILRLWLLQ